MKKMTFALCFCNRGFMPGELIYGAREDMVQAVKTAGHNYIMMDAELTRYGGVETRDEGRLYAKWLKEHDGEYDGVIFSMPIFADENGAITILNEGLLTGDYKQCPSRFFNVWGYAGDDLAFAEGIPGRYKYEQDVVGSLYQLKNEGIMFMKDDKVQALSSEAKKNYSVGIEAAIAEMIVGNKDIDKELAAFVDTNKALWEPVINDLNAAE